ncbi:MAG: ribonuclease E/G, partial [Hyphomicrobiales bacterium]|nr:ribonuclease E/G [Hyphomicrobiales bacterium]
MGNKMLIDAAHPEETRVVVQRGNRVEEFDYESANKKQLRGNIYLAKVTRVEPSLQAAFVNYGGNRHGFLAFSEIHPDYYQLPMAERQALKQEEDRESKAEAHDNGKDGSDEDADNADALPQNASGDVLDPQNSEQPDADYEIAADRDNRASQAAALEAALPPTRYSTPVAKVDGDEREALSSDDVEMSGSGDDGFDSDDDTRADRDSHTENDDNDDDTTDDEDVVSVGSEDAMEEVPQRMRRRRRSYKIQEVIKRGQILLIQVVKEERGNKGAALTTYLSLAGRYTVLMPNTGSGGGISRKISSPSDRKRLREIALELDVPEGMGLIIRTAGAARTKTELKRDYEYLLRLWENVRDLTLSSSAPCLVYEEGDLIKRSIRDLYNKDIDEVLVAGDDAYRDAKDFMRMLMPSHAKNVQPYKEPEPLFTRYEVERQLNAMFSPQVTLPSGGYIIINQTEALVAVDVNSGKSTREFSIEDTALNTNLEAAEEIARQLRLRDLAGLIVVDFIDMEEKRNNRAVERKLKECLRDDRARIQVGRISLFGLLEMSRQRIRTGMLEGSTAPCQHCHGTGFIRSTESVALAVLRSLDDWLRANTPCRLNAVAAIDVVLYIINQKRAYLQDIESRHGVTISLTASDRMQGANFHIEKVSTAADGSEQGIAPVSQSDRIIQPFEGEAVSGEEESGRSSRRRRRRRGRSGSEERENRLAAASATDAETVQEDKTEEPAELAVEGDVPEDGVTSKPRRRSRRRGRRGGRQQRNARAEAAALENPGNEDAPASDETPAPAETDQTEPAALAIQAETPEPAEVPA